MSAADDDIRGCCALVPDHDGCCAFFCSMCNGTGRTCFPDDLGCDCGFCDGYGYCGECGGGGWFNEFGEQCMAPSMSEVTAYGSCDWGGCNDEAERFRWSDEVEGWLPVCASHSAPAPLASEGGTP